ncbi:Not1 N-terminal domain, CCR4-Not complex component-domain-containing protein [Umbelopsis sp. PMI_123]|nr:Not1 N-terminal domain, CCR4-Not complex component-domain-containing protein [Umbelopsis sp. PMI_123]
MAMKKLQTEIDRVLKKVSEGVETFDSMVDKLESAPNINQKEKYESDLKKEIKKLQRLRDQIKSWLQSSEIKDKRALMDNRKLIEQQMERFKAIEKEMKTKAFSKEGLMQMSRMDPKEKEKMETCDWVSSMVDEIARQLEMREAELETLQGGARKKKDHAKMERIKNLENCMERYKWHMNRLELTLRLLQNSRLETDQVLAIQEDVKYYVESNQEPDFEEDEYIYDDLNLEEEEEQYAIAQDESYNDEDTVEKKEEPKPVVKRTSKDEEVSKPASSPIATKADVQTDEATEESPQQTTETEPVQAKSPTTPTSTKAPEPAHAVTPTIRYAQAAASAAHNDSSDAHKKEPIPAPPPIQSAWIEPPKVVADNAKTATSDTPEASNTHPPVSEAQDKAPAPPTPSSATSTSTKSNAAESQSQSIDYTSPPPNEQPLNAIETKFPSALSDLVSAFQAVKDKAQKRDDKLYTHQMLDTSYQFVPDVTDSDRPKYYQPKNPYPTPSYYPQQPLAVFDNPAIFEKFDTDTLFFIFYYQQGTYQQYLAARELKKQSWRFHKKYLTWFQRHEEPSVITEEYEQGTYVYFDYEGAWCQRKKSDFRFSYRFLEDADLS